MFFIERNSFKFENIHLRYFTNKTIKITIRIRLKRVRAINRLKR